jgi:D-alanyl-D-alanine carboxypeptidase/D-alanyl-D-alanine-endopeptidase (penicillin-binding protein 4)
VRDPARFTAAALALALREAGIQITYPPRDTAFDRIAYASAYVPQNVVAVHVSPPLREDVKITLKTSLSLHAAEMPYVLGVYGAHATGDTALQAGFDLEHRFLSDAGLDLNDAAQSDGDGARDLFTPSFVVSYLSWVRTQPWFGDFYEALPILGVDGTLAHVQPDAPARGEVHAKTGSDRFESSISDDVVYSKGLAGYVTTRSGRHVAFCLYINNVPFAHAMGGEGALAQLLGAIANAIYLDG